MEKEKAVTIAIATSMGIAALTGCAKAKTPEIQNSNNETNTPLTQSYTPSNQAEQEPLIEEVSEESRFGVCVSFGDYGTYCEVEDSILGKGVLPWSEDNKVEEGSLDLTDLKTEGGVVEFEMPKDGVINSITGDIEITTKDENGQEVTEELIPGNPAMDEDENPIIPASSKVKITYEKDNPSNGLQIIFEAEKTLENLRLDFGDYGIAKAIFNPEKNAWLVGLDEGYLAEKGIKTLHDLKIEGGVFEFVMPFDGYINNSAGFISSNDKELLLGNPVEDEEGDVLIKAGDSIVIKYGTNNDSAGFEIEFVGD